MMENPQDQLGVYSGLSGVPLPKDESAAVDTSAVWSVSSDEPSVCMVIDTVSHEVAAPDTLPLLYKDDYLAKDSLSALVDSGVSWGKQGIDIPYNFRSDNVVTGLMMFCFLLLCYVFSHGRHFLWQQIKDFLYTRERSSIFSIETGAEYRYRTALCLLASVALGLLFYDYTLDVGNPEGFWRVPTFLPFVIYIGVIILFYLLKWGVYSFVNWVFFNKAQRLLWIENYFLVVPLMGIALYPLILLVAYFDLSFQKSFFLFITLLFLCKISLIYKCFSIFYNKRYGFLYLIVYFCALELVPCLFIWEALVQINSLLML